MARGVQSYFRETALGLRRNGIVAFAAMSTAFIALFLFGLALLIAREFNLVIDAWTGNVQVAVYLTDPPNPETVKLLTGKLKALPAGWKARAVHPIRVPGLDAERCLVELARV